jgi:hypothetical protein
LGILKRPDGNIYFYYFFIFFTACLVGKNTLNALTAFVVSRISFLQIAIVTRYSNFGQGLDYNNIGGLDYIFAGIWAGWFYGVAGIVGIFGSYERKRVQ